MNIVFLPAWYPHRGDDMEGLFVRKHARAAARHHQIHVLFLKAEAGLKETCVEEKTEKGLTESIIYYPLKKSAPAKMISFIKAYRSGFNEILRKYGKPDLVHVHVMTRHAVAARIIQLRHHIPYVITEHWSRYFRHDFRNFLHVWLTRKTARKARRIIPVSRNLEEAMLDCGIKGLYTVVPNVVDDFFFHTSPPRSSIKRILHVCCFDEAAKNNFGLLRSVKKLLAERDDFLLVMAGDGKDRQATQAYARRLGLPEDKVVFAGKIQPAQVKEELEKSSFMVLFSNYETQSVVICESLASGKPVVASRVGGIPEIVDESNGILVEPGDEDALCHALNRMLDNFGNYDPEEILRGAQRFSFAEVGMQLSRIYAESVD